MAYIFPPNPNIGDTTVGNDGHVYRWDGVKWKSHGLGVPPPLTGGPYLETAGGTMTGPLVLTGDPQLPLWSATKEYVDNEIAAIPSINALPLAGGQMLGPLFLDADPAVGLGAATKRYVDDEIAAIPPPNLTGFLPYSGGTLTGPLRMDADPVTAMEAATKQYVDSHAGGGGGGGGGGGQGVIDGSDVGVGEIGEVLTLFPTPNAKQVPLGTVGTLDPVTLPPGDWDFQWIVVANVNVSIVLSYVQWTISPNPIAAVTPSNYRNAPVQVYGPISSTSLVRSSPPFRCLSAVPVLFTLNAYSLGTPGTADYIQYSWYLRARRMR